MPTPDSPPPAPLQLTDVPPPAWPGRIDRGEVEVLGETVAWEDKALRVYDSRVRYPARDGGAPVDAHHSRIAPAEGKGEGVVVAPVDEHGRVLLVRQFRHPVRRWMTECPRGGLEPGETPEQAAARELREETGAEATAFVPLGRVAPDSGQQSQLLWLVAAHVHRGGPAHPEPTEAIDRVVPMTYAALRAACERGEIFDGFTLAAVLRLAPYARGDALALPWAPP